MRSQISDETVPSMKYGPARPATPDIFIDAFKNRPAQFQFRIDFVERRGPLQI